MQQRIFDVVKSVDWQVIPTGQQMFCTSVREGLKAMAGMVTNRLIKSFTAVLLVTTHEERNILECCLHKGVVHLIKTIYLADDSSSWQLAE